MIRCRSLALSGLALISLVTPLLAQITTASITGFVTDKTGGSLQGARVTAVHTATGFTRSVTSGSDGGFTVSSLAIGTYSLTAELVGFKKYEVSEFGPLTVGAVARADIALEVGEVRETVSVTAQAPLVRATTSETSVVVDQKRMVDLPLNGRNPVGLLTLYAGAAVVNAPTLTSGMRGGATVSVNGSRLNQTDYLFDGGHFNGIYFNTALAYPSPDALAEFQLVTHSYSAEYGRNSGSIMNAVTKSGTNDFHGSLFEFLRNNRLNARNFFSPRVPKLAQNQFGAVAGGRIVKDKLFFFGSYQGLRIREEQLITGVLPPTEKERLGDFSGSPRAVVDPETGNPFPGNIIPRSQLNPVALNAIQTRVPLPGPDGTLPQLFPRPSVGDQYMGKIDWNLSSNDRLNGRYFFDRATIRMPFGNVIKYSRGGQENYVNDVNLRYTKALKPTFLNEFLFEFSRTRTTAKEEETYSAIDLGVDKSYGVEGDPSPPVLNVAGRMALGGAPGFTEIGRLQQYRDTVSWVRGKHQYKFGGEFLINNYYNKSQFPANGMFQFTGLFTGNSMADFMLGKIQSLLRISKYLVDDRSFSYYFFGNDDFKVTPRLTLNLGFRYEINTPYVILGRNEQATFVPGMQSKVYPQAPTGLVFPGDVPAGLYPIPKKNVQPRIGFAYDPIGKGKTVIRGAYGIFADIAVPDVIAQAHFNQPFVLRNNLFAPPGGLSNPYLGIDPKPFPYTPPTPGDTSFRFQVPADLTPTSPSFTDPRIQQWNLSVEQQFLDNFALEIGYVGTVASHLQWTWEANPARFIPGNGPDGPLSTAANVNSRRIYNPGQIGAVQFASSDGFSSYHALQLSLTRRLAHGLLFSGAYTFSRTLDDTTSYSVGGIKVQNPFNRRAEKGLSDIHRAQKFSSSAIYNLPALKNLNPAARYVFGDWELSTIVTAGTGTPFTVVSGRNQSLDGLGADRPDLVGDPLAVTRRDRADTINAFINRNAFALPQLGSYGNVGRNTLIGPGFWNADIGIMKYLPVREDVRFQLRGELFNAFNHTNLAGVVNNFAAPNFGRITSSGSPRIAQVALKLYF